MLVVTWGILQCKLSGYIYILSENIHSFSLGTYMYMFVGALVWASGVGWVGGVCTLLLAYAPRKILVAGETRSS